MTRARCACVPPCIPDNPYEGHVLIRLAASWATTHERVDELALALEL